MNKFGADPTKKDNNGKNALLVACGNNKQKVAEILIQHHKTQLDEVDNDKETALHKACKKSNEKLVQLMLEKKASHSLVAKSK